jgi:HEAT repeat protein
MQQLQASRPLPRARHVLAVLFTAALLCAFAHAQDAQKSPQPAATQPTPINPDASIAGEPDLPSEDLPAKSTPAQRADRAWSMLTDAAAPDPKHPQTRIQALAAVGMLRNPRAAKLIEAAMHDPDLDVRTAAALAAGQSGDRNLTTPLRELLDDPEPQVVFTAAMTLWKMNDRSGEDILMAVADGERSANPTLINGTKHKIDSTLHDPAKMAKLGAMQGASMLLGPFGFGIAAFNFIHQSGGDLARASAIEAIAQERTPPIHKELLAALADKDPAVRAAAAKGLVDYRDPATSLAVYALFVDPKNPVRLTAAAAYLRTTGIPGPTPASAAKLASAPR